MKKILIIDDEREVGNFLHHFLTKKGYQVEVGYNGKQFLELIDKNTFSLAMIDVKLPDTNGLDILKQLKERQPSCKVIIMTGYSTVQTAVEAIKIGATDYIEKPFDSLDQLESLIDEMLFNDVSTTEGEVKQLSERIGFVIGNNQEIKHLLTMAYKIAQKNINVLIQGETGTGKEVLARFIHEASQRVTQKFLGVNCGALSESLLESELFGHEKGSFTGATQLRKGLFEMASSGTLFLDEIGEASHAIQVKLLRVLETREFMRLGSEQTLRTNARIIAASHVNLEHAVEEKKFREDLLYRLNVVKLEIPPLRERKEDIPTLVSYFLEKYGAVNVAFTNDAIEKLSNYNWPGNIRELVNVITRALTLAEGETNQITSAYLPRQLLAVAQPSNPVIEDLAPQKNAENPIFTSDELKHYLCHWNENIVSFWENEDSISLDQVTSKIKELENNMTKAFITRALRDALGNRKVAAKQLNISQRQLRYLLNEKKHSTR
ncbi:sigma-54-dependent transcriptional regulator [Anaerobacillus sp. MEB173]|uniref:sigma-54-dependent transcriptional regulator n=1 Tax=Anaerobacillus sp. MEB173 TaxID=3383345 RepID=UPI003F8F789E